jgi:hypothetical protein
MVATGARTTLDGFAFEICPVGGPLKRESRALPASLQSDRVEATETRRA